MVDRSDGPTLGELIRSKGNRNALCRNAHAEGFPFLVTQNLDRYVNHEDRLIAYPKPETMEAIAAGTGESYWDVQDAAARSLGRPRLWTPKEPTVIVLDENLTAAQVKEVRAAIRRVTRGHA